MTIENSDGINILLVSSSKLLKNKFIESISNELNNFTLMTKSIESPIENNRININCFISDYSIELENSKYATKYVQLIDGSDKSIIYSLIENTYSTKKNSQYFIASIIYLYDESNSDTFAYIQSIHNELKSNFENFILSNDLTCLLCNMINVTNLESNQSSSDESFKILNVVQNFLDQFNNIQYISQPFENSILGSVPVVSNSEETNNKLRINFDFIVDRYFSFVPKQDSTYIDINSYSNSLNTTSLKKSINTFKNENFKHNYKGEISNNLRNGFGIYVYDNKFFRYEGEWKDGIKDGNGKFIMKDGSFYEGEFRDGEMTGKGYKYDKTRETEYTGDFLEGHYQGKGVLRCRNKYVYEGDFDNNMKHGYGELNEFKMNQNYKGQWYLNKRHGQGSQKYTDGSVYTGDWIRDKRQGHGDLEYSNGNVYDGQWRNDLMNGHGFYKSVDGYSYEGIFENGLPVKFATQLVFDFPEEKKFEIYEGFSSQFKIVVKSLNEENEVFKEENRTIQLTFGFKVDITDTNKYENEIGTEFGFSYVPIQLFAFNESAKFKFDSYLVEENENLNDTFIDAKNSGQTNQNDNKFETKVVVQGEDIVSLSSKAFEQTANNQNGEALFNNLFVDNVQLPKKIEEIIETKKITRKSSSNLPKVPSIGNKLSPDLSKFHINENSMNCVLIAEDLSNPPIFGKRLKSTYLDCVFYVKQIEARKSSSRNSISIEAKTKTKVGKK